MWKEVEWVQRGPNTTRLATCVHGVDAMQLPLHTTQDCVTALQHGIIVHNVQPAHQQKSLTATQRACMPSPPCATSAPRPPATAAHGVTALGLCSNFCTPPHSTVLFLQLTAWRLCLGASWSSTNRTTCAPPTPATPTRPILRRASPRHGARGAQYCFLARLPCLGPTICSDRWEI